MPKLYVDANPRMVAYVLEGNVTGSGSTRLPKPVSAPQAEYYGIIYGINEYFLKWNKELDARQFDIDQEASKHFGEPVFTKVASASQETKRPLPPPLLVLSDNEPAVKQLSRQYHIKNDEIRRLAQHVWTMTQNIDVKFEYIPRNENLAGKMLK